MARKESLDEEPWLLIDPDPGSFTQLCSRMGAQGVQVEQVQTLKRESIQTLRPAYGITILLRHKPDKSIRDEPYTTNSNVYFANQVVHEAYAVYAMLSILLNCEDTIELGSELRKLKEFTGEFPPMLKGLSVTNSSLLKEAHNSIARRRQRQMIRDNAIYHYITYIPIGGHLWEMDGFKRGPLRLAPCTRNTWMETACVELQRKIESCQRQQIPFSIWSVIEDRRRVLQRRLVGRGYLKLAIEHQLDRLDANWRTVVQAQLWEEEYNHAMEAERRKRGVATAMHSLYAHCRSVNDLPDEEKAELQQELKSEVEGRPVAELMDLWLQVQDDSLRLQGRLADEHEKREKYEQDSIRRRHDYTPFIRAYISCLASHGHLQRMMTDSI